MGLSSFHTVTKKPSALNDSDAISGKSLVINIFVFCLVVMLEVLLLRVHKCVWAAPDLINFIMSSKIDRYDLIFINYKIDTYSI
jgi:hypothetical protein